MKLRDKVAVITGASDGIGKQIALKLSLQGVNLALVGRNQTNLKKVADDCRKNGSAKVCIYQTDLRNIDQIKQTSTKILSDFKVLDILVNNAGVWQKLNSLEKINDAEIEDNLNTNMRAHIYMTKYFLSTLKKQKESAIINVISRSGYTAQKDQSVYSASKWAMAGFTEVLKQDLKDTPVRVAAIYQGGTDTEMFKKAGESFEQGKFIHPGDLADVVVFMLTRPPQIWLHDVRVEY